MKSSIIKRIQHFWGIDKAIFFTSLARVIQAFGGVVSIIFIARYLTGVEQGFYYTFGSIVAIQIFFELGLNSIITQYVAHEISHLKWETSIKLSGDGRYLSRLSSLLHFSVKWYLFFAIILFFTLVIVGFIFFDHYGNHDDIQWKIPWVVLALSTSLNLLISPFFAYLEGLGKIKEVAKMRLWQQIIGLIIVWGGLAIGIKLYVLCANVLFCFIFLFCSIAFTDFKSILLRIWHIQITERVNYRSEIFPYQWKIALSWISGYFIFQLFNPVLFVTEGAIVAGQMGMTLAALNGIQALSFSWMTTKIPLYSGLIALKRYVELDIIFYRTLKQSVLINSLALILLFFAVFLIRYYDIVIGGLNLGGRFLAYFPMILLMIPLFINQFVNSWALYLRCHKQEPFLINSIACGILCCLSTLLLGKYFGVLGITSGYCLIIVVMSFWGYQIFKTKKKSFHGQ